MHPDTVTGKIVEDFTATNTDRRAKITAAFICKEVRAIQLFSSSRNEATIRLCFKTLGEGIQTIQMYFFFPEQGYNTYAF